MKKIILLAFIAVGLLAFSANALFAATVGTSADVQPVETGVGETQAMQFGVKTVLAVGSSTRFTIELSDTEGHLEKVTLAMEKGDLGANVKAGLGKRAQVKISTPNLVAKTSSAQLQVLHDSATKISRVIVTRGTVRVTDEKGRGLKLVRKGFETMVDEAGRPTKPVKTSKSASAKPSAAKSDSSSMTFTFGSGVSAEDEALIRKGIEDMAIHLTKWFGRTVTNATAIKTTDDANDTTCCNVGGSGSGSWITFHTKHAEWLQAKLAALLFTDMRQQLALHELVHTYQTQYGCGRQEQPVALRWFNEGMAEWLAFRAMTEMGVVTEAQVLDYTRFMYKNAKAETLSAYELYHKGVDYSVFFLAIDQLMKKSPIISLDSFCANLGKGQEKTEAFKSAFGTSLSQFYADFEAYREEL